MGLRRYFPQRLPLRENWVSYRKAYSIVVLDVCLHTKVLDGAIRIDIERESVWTMRDEGQETFNPFDAETNHMRCSMPEERAAYQRMLRGMSVPLTKESELLELKAENAKLRDLVRDMWHDMPKSESCGWDSEHNHCTGYDSSCNGECSYWYRMNGLGIEAD